MNFTYLKSHFNKAEFISILQTFVGVVGVEALSQWNVLLSGNFSKEALFALGAALIRSLVKAIWIVFTTQPAGV